MMKRLMEIIDSLSAIQAPALWKTAWLLPFSATMIIFLLTGSIRSGSFTQAALMARILMLLCMFLISHTLILLLRFFKEQAEAAVKTESMEKLLEIQSDQYNLLTARIRDSSRARHDFRQHLHVIAGLTEAGQVDELKNYLHQYESELSEERPTLCANPAVDALAGHYDHEAHSLGVPVDWRLDRKSTRLNSSHITISYAVSCLKKKKNKKKEEKNKKK